MLEQVSALIDKKEAPGNLERAVGILEELKQEQPQNDIICGKLAHAYYFRGRFAPEKSPQRLQMFEKGVVFGKEAITLNPRALYGSYWYGSNLGMLGMCRGIMSSLKSIPAMKSAIEVVLRSNERFFFGGPHRSLGRLYHKAPPWPISIGKKSKAEEHLSRAVQLGPDYFLNRIFLAEFLLDTGKKRQARPHIEYLVESPLNPDHQIEDGEYKTQARALYRKHFN